MRKNVGAPHHDQPLKDWIRVYKIAGPKRGLPYENAACGKPLSHPSQLRVKLDGYAYCPGCKTFVAVTFRVEMRLKDLARAEGVDTDANMPPPEVCAETKRKPRRTLPMWDFEPNLNRDGTAK